MLVKSRLHDTRNGVNIDGGRGAPNQKEKEADAHRYHSRCGGRYDAQHDQSPSPEPVGTRVFSREIRTAPISPRFRQPTTLTKYSGETDPRVWLGDYWEVPRMTP